MKKFAINKYLNLTLKDKKTYIYVGEKEILNCKKVGIKIPPNKISDYLKYETIDDLENQNYVLDEDINIDPETEFFVHCSNLQTWENNGYNTDLIHSSIAFPILKELMEIGDLRAKRVFKEEIVKRFLNGSQSTQDYLILEGYIQCLSLFERDALFGKECFKVKSLESYIGYNIKIISGKEPRYGVKIQDRKIIGLHLSGKDNKTRNVLFPYLIKNFKNLEILYLEGFKTITIPKWIENLDKLRKLKLNQNKLAVIPKSIGKLKNLEYLDLAINFLDKLPKEIELLKKVKRMNFNFNKFKNFPKEVLGLDRLEYLNLSHNQIKLIPTEIETMHSLKLLGLSENPISSLPDELLSMPNLEKVFIGGSNIKINDDFKKELKKRNIKIFPSGLLEFEILHQNSN